MYSKNDYRYYLEHQLLNSDDYLAHYGVKNMKWGKHKRKELANLVAQGAKNISTPEPISTNIVYGAEIAKKTAQRSIVKKDASKKSKNYKKLRISNILNNGTKSLFKRSKPKGKKLKGGGNIYVSHD